MCDEKGICDILGRELFQSKMLRLAGYHAEILYASLCRTASELHCKYELHIKNELHNSDNFPYRQMHFHKQIQAQGFQGAVLHAAMQLRLRSFLSVKQPRLDVKIPYGTFIGEDNADRCRKHKCKQSEQSSPAEPVYHPA